MKENGKRQMVVVLPGITDTQRSEITEAAEKHDFSVSIFESANEATPALAEAEVILGSAASLASSAPKLKWLCTSSAGVNQFTAPGAFLSAEAMLSNSSGAYGVTISEHIIMTALMILRRQPEYTSSVAARQWQRDLPMESLQGSCIVLLGTGDIGQTTARRLRAFAPKSIIGINRSGKNPENLFDRVIRQTEMDAILPQTDMLICSLPGTPETFHLLDEKRLSLLRPGALLVNVGRGTAVDEQALEKLLRENRLRAALDVFEQEPLPKESDLWDCPNLLITPHAAGGFSLPYTRQRVVELFLEDFERYCAGKPLARRVDPAQGY